MRQILQLLEFISESVDANLNSFIILLTGQYTFKIFGMICFISYPVPYVAVQFRCSAFNTRDWSADCHGVRVMSDISKASMFN